MALRNLDIVPSWEGPPAITAGLLGMCNQAARLEELTAPPARALPTGNAQVLRNRLMEGHHLFAAS
jgi:hypothetical protein